MPLKLGSPKEYAAVKSASTIAVVGGSRYPENRASLTLTLMNNSRFFLQLLRRLFGHGAALCLPGLFSGHFHRRHMNLVFVGIHMRTNANIMSFVPFDGIGIADGPRLIVLAAGKGFAVIAYLALKVVQLSGSTFCRSCCFCGGLRVCGLRARTLLTACAGLLPRVLGKG